MWLSFLKSKPNCKIGQSCFYFSFLLLGLKCWFITSLSCYKLSVYLSPTLHNLPLSDEIIIQQLYIAVQKANFVNFFKIIIWKQVCFPVKEHDAVVCSLLRLETWSRAVAFNLPTFFFNQRQHCYWFLTVLKIHQACGTLTFIWSKTRITKSSLFTLCVLCESKFRISCYCGKFLVLPRFPSPPRMLELQEA